MTRIIVFSCITAGLVLGILQTAGASGPACFNYGKTKDYDRLCIVTKIEGNRMCMVDYYAPSKTRGAHEVCEYIRNHGNAKTGDQILVDATEWKGYPDKCYKSPGCGKAIVVSSTTASAQSGATRTTSTAAVQQRTPSTVSTKKGASQVTYTSVDAICTDGKRAAGKIAEISGLSVHDAFPDDINLNFRDGSKICGRLLYVSLKPSKALADKFEPYGPGKNRHNLPKLTVTFKVVNIGADRINGEYVDLNAQPAQPEASSLPPPPQAPVQGSTSLPPPPLPEGVQGQQQGVPTASLPAPPQQPQPQAQPPAQQEPQQPVTQTIDSTLNIFKKARDLFK